MQGRVWHTMTELAGKSLTVAGVSLKLAPLSMTGKVIVWHAMTQNWQVRLLMTANQWSVRGFCISIWSAVVLYKYMDKLNLCKCTKLHQQFIISMRMLFNYILIVTISMLCIITVTKQINKTQCACSSKRIY